MNVPMRNRNQFLRLSALVIAVPAMLYTLPSTAAPEKARSGKVVVETVCVGCHETGKDGAPRIGDQAEWSKRASVGLGVITRNAITGVRKMPAHGGNAALSDLEVSRAVAYMVSGGKAVDPDKPYSSPSQIAGGNLVKARCSECHTTGKDGAPRIGHMESAKAPTKAASAT